MVFTGHLGRGLGSLRCSWRVHSSSIVCNVPSARKQSFVYVPWLGETFESHSQVLPSTQLYSIFHNFSPICLPRAENQLKFGRYWEAPRRCSLSFQWCYTSDQAHPVVATRYRRLWNYPIPQGFALVITCNFNETCVWKKNNRYIQSYWGQKKKVHRNEIAWFFQKFFASQSGGECSPSSSIKRNSCPTPKVILVLSSANTIDGKRRHTHKQSRTPVPKLRKLLKWLDTGLLLRNSVVVSALKNLHLKVCTVSNFCFRSMKPQCELEEWESTNDKSRWNMLQLHGAEKTGQLMPIFPVFFPILPTKMGFRKI